MFVNEKKNTLVTTSFHRTRGVQRDEKMVIIITMTLIIRWVVVVDGIPSWGAWRRERFRWRRSTWGWWRCRGRRGIRELWRWTGPCSSSAESFSSSPIPTPFSSVFQRGRRCEECATIYASLRSSFTVHQNSNPVDAVVFSFLWKTSLFLPYVIRVGTSELKDNITLNFFC